MGMAVGGALWQSKQKDPSGRRTPKYNAAARRHGIAQMVVGGIVFAFSLQFAGNVNLFSGNGGPPEAPPSSGTPATTTPSGGSEAGAQPTRPPETGGIQPSGGAQPTRPAGGGASPQSLGLTPNLQPQDDFEELVLDYLNYAYEENLEEEGFGAAIHRVFGSLNQDRSEDVSFRLPTGADIAIFGVCDNECSDLNFMLFSEEGRLVDQDNLDDDIPLVVVETGGSVQQYTVRVEMASCSIAPCYYAVGVYRR